MRIATAFVLVALLNLCSACVASVNETEPPSVASGTPPSRTAPSLEPARPTNGASSPHGSEEFTIETIAYADEHPSQVGDLYLPAEPRDTLIVLIHGGFWYEQYGRESVAPLAEDLAERGYPVWSITYRRVGGGGGWPETFADVATALDHVGELPVEPDRIVAIGHSAGGHLALWAAARQRLPDDRVGAQPDVVPDAVVGLAAVSDLRAAARQGLGADAVTKLLGGEPSEVPERLRVAAPLASIPLGVPQLLVHGRSDRLVPPEMSEQYATRARAAGDRVDLELVEGGHFEVIDPSAEPWQLVLERLEDMQNS